MSKLAAPKGTFQPHTTCHKYPVGILPSASNMQQVPVIGFLQVLPAGRVLENSHFHTGWWAPCWALPDELAAAQALVDKTKQKQKKTWAPAQHLYVLSLLTTCIH